ncbi:lipopolysaccharide export system protein LptA [Gammaproteobacteria bacterium]
MKRRSPIRRLVESALWLVACLTAPFVLALPSDRQQPVSIEADQADMDEQKGVSVYRGNVSLTQGSMVLRCEILTAYHAPETRSLIKATAEGTPARFRQRPAPDKEEVIATAPRMEYFVDKQVVYLLEKGEVTQGHNVFRGKRVEYSINDNQVHAESGSAPGERVHVTLFPQDRGKSNNSSKTLPSQDKTDNALQVPLPSGEKP